MGESRIPFNRPFIAGKELYYIAKAVMSGKLAGDGMFTFACQEWLEQRFGSPKVLLTHSCTAALEMAAILCDLAEGDEVIMPSFTFVSTANAVVLRGARPVFVDIRPDTLNIDEGRIEAAITARTKVILPVHYAGVGCDMDAILALARARGLRVIEDAAQGVNATYKGRYLGTVGDLGCWSFHETKNYICGEGGALAINNPDLIERAEIIREKGTNRRKFARGEVDKYTWVDVGSSFLPSEIIAAFLYAQLEAAETITKKRKSIFDLYAEQFHPLEEKGILKAPYIPPHCGGHSHMFYLVLPDRATRDGLIANLAKQQIHGVFHYIPLHDSPMGRRYGYAPGDFPVTERISERLVRLPCYYELTPAEQARVVGAVKAYLRCG